MLSKAQRVGLPINFDASGTGMCATGKGRTMLMGESEATIITELTGMVPLRNGKFDVVFFNAGKDDSTRLAHSCMGHTAVGTL